MNSDNSKDCSELRIVLNIAEVRIKKVNRRQVIIFNGFENQTLYQIYLEKLFKGPTKSIMDTSKENSDEGSTIANILCRCANQYYNDRIMCLKKNPKAIHQTIVIYDENNNIIREEDLTAQQRNIIIAFVKIQIRRIDIIMCDIKSSGRLAIDHSCFLKTKKEVNIVEIGYANGIIKAYEENGDSYTDPETGEFIQLKKKKMDKYITNTAHKCGMEAPKNIGAQLENMNLRADFFAYIHSEVKILDNYVIEKDKRCK
jgi:hypothetical protein